MKPNYTQTLTISLKGDDYEHSASMTKDEGISLDEDLFSFLKAALITAGFSHDSIEGFFKE